MPEYRFKKSNATSWVSSQDRRVVLELPARELAEGTVAVRLALGAPLLPHRRPDMAQGLGFRDKV